MIINISVVDFGLEAGSTFFAIMLYSYFNIYFIYFIRKINYVYISIVHMRPLSYKFLTELEMKTQLIINTLNVFNFISTEFMVTPYEYTILAITWY